MSNEEKVAKIREIYNDFLKELAELKEQADDRTKNHIESIEKKEIDKILDNINNQ